MNVNGSTWINDDSLVSAYDNWCPGHNATEGEAGVYEVAGNCWKSADTSGQYNAACMKFPPACRNFPVTDYSFGQGRVFRGTGRTDYM